MSAQEQQPAPAPDLLKAVTRALRKVHDPEIPVNIVDLGLIYDIDFEGDAGERVVNIVMTLTTPNCPVADKIPEQVKQAALAVDGVASVNVELTWEPQWTPDRMTEAAKLELEFTGHTGPAHLRPQKVTRLTLNRGDADPRD